MAGSPTSSARSSRVLSFPSGTFHIQSGSGLVLDIESGFLKDPLKANARVELNNRKSIKSSADSIPLLEQQLWRTEDGYIVNVRTGHVLDVQGAVHNGSRVIQNVRKTGKDAVGQHWLNDDGVLTLASNTKFVVTVDGDPSRSGTRIIIQEKKAYNDKQKWYYNGGGDSRPASPSPSRAESLSIRPDNFPTSWFYIKSKASGLVVDIEHGLFTDPMKAGARAEMNHQKIDNGDGRHSLLELQLWRYESGFLINRRTGFVLDIQGGTLKLAARVVQWQRKSGKDAQNQHWFYENGFIANVYNSRLVLDIDGDGSKDGAKIAIGERKAAANADQQWVLEEAKFTWLVAPSSTSTIEVQQREIVVPAAVQPTTTTTLPLSGWFYIKSLSSGHVIDIEGDSMAPNLVITNSLVTASTTGDTAAIESQLWRYQDGQLINRRSGYVLDCKQGVVRYGARLMQAVSKQGKEAQHQRWESVNGALVIQGKPTFAIDIEGDGSKAGSRLSLQRPKAQNNLDQQWVFQLANYEWLSFDRVITRTIVETVTKSQVVEIQSNDWFYIKSASGMVMDLEAGWITSPTDVGAYISMRKQRSLEDSDKSLVERQLWRYEDGYFINRRTGYVIDIYGRSAVVGVKLVQHHKATTEEDGQYNQLWNLIDGNIQLRHNPKLIINVESNKDGSRVQLVENKATKITVNAWTLEVARASFLAHERIPSRSASYNEGMEEAKISIHATFPTQAWFYIKSKASGFVLDVEHGFLRDHSKPGANIELNHQKLRASAKRHALLELQLWKFQDGFVINRRTGLVLDVAQATLLTGTRVIQWSRKSANNENQQWAVTNGFIHLKSRPNYVLDIDGDGTRDGAKLSIKERKEKKNLDQRWSFEAVHFTWLKTERDYTSVETDVELLKEYETTHLARVVEHSTPPSNCWFYLKSGISDLVLELEHGRQIQHLKPGTHVHLAHQKLKSGKHSHALLELQLWRFQDGLIVNRRSNLALAVDKIEGNAKLIQATKTGADTQRWTIVDGVIRLAARKEFVLFLSYGRQGSRAFIRKERRGEVVLQNWSFAEVHFSWLTLEPIVTEQVEEQLDTLNESEVTFLAREKAITRKLESFSEYSYFFIRASNGYVVDIEHGLGKNHMKVGAYASVHPQTSAASANQHALLDIQLWTLKDGYLINKRTGLALTIEGDAKQGSRLVQALHKNAIKWTIEGGYISPIGHSHLALNIRDGSVILVERSTSITWSVYEVSFSWLVWTEVVYLEVENREDLEFYEEFEEVVMRSSAGTDEVIEYAETEQYVIAPKEAWFYLVAGNKVASISTSQLLEKGGEGASIRLDVQKRFSSVQRHALVELQLWKFVDSYIINRITGLYLTVTAEGGLILSAKQSDSSRQKWQFSEQGELSLVSNTSQIVDFVDEKAVLVDRSISQTVWLYETTNFGWLASENVSDFKEIEREITEYRTVYTRYVQYITKYTITTTTTRTITRYIVRVHPQCTLENATVVEREGTIWATHLVEAGTNVSYEMQLLLDNTESVYYIYVQWGSTNGTLEGPYKTVEAAEIAYKETFADKVGIDWSERENPAALGESWSVEEIAYETVTENREESAGGKVVQKEVGTSTTTTTSTHHSLVDVVCPIADQVQVYKDSENYHTILSQRSTGVTYIYQMLYNYVTKTYYVYLRWGETDYNLDGPYDTIEQAKSVFTTKYSETFGVTWEERTIVTNTEWAIVHHDFGTEEQYITEADDNEVDVVTTIIDDDRAALSTKDDSTIIYHQKVETVVDDQATKDRETSTETTTTVLEINKPAVSKGSSWFRRIASGAGIAAAGALTQVDGVWKRTVEVLTTRKAHVDKVCPIAKTSYVYYDDDVYDAVLTEKSTGVTYVTQLLYDTNESAYYVYIRWGEIDYKLDGPHKTIESAKSAFQVTYHDKFGVEWTERETTVNDTWSYEVKTYETFEEVEEIEETYDEEEATIILAREKETIVSDNTKTTETSTTVIQDQTVVSTVQDETVIVDNEIASKESVVTSTSGKDVTIETTVENVITEVDVSDVKSTDSITETTTTKEVGVIAKPAVSKGSSWFRRLATGAGVAAVGALTQVDGVWKRTVQVLTTRKAHVDKVCPIAKTSYVYYDDDVYDAVLTEKSTGVTYVTQLLYDTNESAYYVYIRWGEIDYKLDGPHKTIESAKSAFQVTYHDKFGVQWTERETAVNDTWSYEVKTYETFEETEEIEETVEESQVEQLKQEERSAVAAVKTTEKVVIKEGGVVAKPAVSKGSSWFRRVASGAGAAASGALTQVDGVWKRTVQVLTTRKAHVDKVCPIAKTSYVYYDDDVYDAVLTEKSTGVTYITQLLYDTNESAYYVYIRWGEIDYKLDGPHKTIESAKSAFQVTYHDKFGVEWTERETTVNDAWSYEVKTYETFEETEEIEEVVDETEITKEVVLEQTVIDKEKEVEVETHTSTTTTSEEVVLEHTTSEVVEGDEAKETTITKETGVVAKPAVSKGSSWFRRIASGAGAAASGALTQVDGVWKRTVQVLTTRKAHVDKICPIAKTSYVYYDDDVYDAVLTEKSTGVTYVTQLLYDTNESAYYVYIRWGEIDYKLDGPHKTIESAKSAFQVTYHDKFGVEWTERETAVNDTWSYEVKTYETFEETEEIEETVEESQVEQLKQEERSAVAAVKTTEKVVIKEGGVVAKPAVSKGSSWFRRIASGAGAAASGALTQVDGVWKRTVQVLTTRKAHVDKVCPIAKTSYVYYDDDVYDAVLTEKSTGVTYITQLLYDTTKSAYYVYIRWGEIDYKLDGPHETIESAKSAFQVTYHDKFGVEWTERETTVSDAWSYEVKTYETFEETEEIEEVVDETEISTEVVREQTVVDKAKEVEVNTSTSTTTTSEEVVLEHTTSEIVAVDEAKETVVTKETGVVAKPAVSKGSSWFRRLATGAGVAAVGALTQVDGVWKRTVQVLTTRKAHVDKVCPIAKTSYVYYDDDVYDAVLTEKSTGVTYVTQLLYDTNESAYYVYIRWGEIDYKLDGPHKTIESAKSAFQVTYHDKFGVEWTERETTVSDTYSYEVKTYESFEETEEIEEVVDETEITKEVVREQTVVDKEKEVEVETHTSTTTTSEEVVLEHTTSEIVEVDEAKETLVTKETGVVAKPAVSKGSSWFRRIASGAGAAASGALTQVDGVWKRTVQVLTTRKAHVDKVCPIAKTSYVYYDDDVYDAVLTEKSTGVTYVTQLLYDTTKSAYYVYVRWGEIDYKLDGPHETIESAKSAFQVTYHDKFGVEWTERETTVNDSWSYEVKTYESFEETEEIEEIVDENEITKEVVREQTVVDMAKDVEVNTSTSTTTTSEEVVLEHTTSEVVEVDEAKETTIIKETGVVAKPAVSKGSSWFRRIASGAGAAASGALTQVDGVWKRTVQVLTTRKAHVDKVCPIAKTSYVYYDDDVYDAVLTEKSTGVTYVTQLLYDTNESAYYVYVRWGEIDYKLDGPHETIESAKSAFQVTYHDKFGVEWTERETTVSDTYSYEVKTYESFEETEEIEEVVDETEITKEVVREQTVIDKEKEVEVETRTSTTTTSKEVVLEHTTSEVVEVDEAKETLVTKETGVVAKPAVSKGSSWFRRIASGAGAAASGALTQVDGVWKRTVQVLTTRKAHVDKICPIAKTSYVYYDDDVYDAVLTEKSTGVTYVTQLLYDTNESAYYVYVRWGEIDYKLDGPHKTIESAKSAFQVTYHDKFGVQWTERETAVNDAYSYEVKTYETFEETEEIEEVVDETEITKEVVREQTVVDNKKEVEVETHTSTTTTSEEVVLEHTTSEVVEVDEAKETLVTKETGVVAKPAVSKGSSWFRRIASGAGAAASGALTQVDGVWKRTIQVLTTRKAHVDKICPIAKTSYVYYDDDVYDAVLTEKSTGVTYVTQLLYDTNESAYYVYVRWGEIDYKLDGPHETIESAKSAFQVTYHDKFGVEWTERETTVSDTYSYEVKTYESFEETEEIEEVVDETEITKEVVREQTVVDNKKEVEVETHTSTTTTSEEVVLEHTTSEVVEVDEAKETLVTKETGVVAKPAVSKGSSWFRRLATGAGVAAVGALTQVDGVWKRTVQVLTTRKAHVDKVCPIAKTSYVYYDDDVYDAVLTEKSTGVTYVTQLLYDTNESAYYVYIRWGEIDYKLDGPHETIESAKSAFQVTYHDKFGVEWTERETAVNDAYSYEVKTYETFEETEEIEEVVDETEITKEVVREQTVVDNKKEVEVETHTSTTTTSEEVVLEHTTSEVVEVDEAKETLVTKETGVVAKPAVSKGSSWFRRIASGAGAAASGALTQVDGVWKRTVQVLTTRKAHVDKVCPIAKTSYVYYDDDVYDAVLTEKSTGVTYVTQLLYDTNESAYYVYIRWGEIDYKLDGPHETIESAKSAFQVTYHDKFGVEWTERETAVNDAYSYEVKTYETFEETEEIEEVVDETEISTEVVREQTVVDNKKEVEVETHTSTTTTSEEVVLEHTTSEIVEIDEAKETVVTKETGVVAKPAVSKGSSWFRRIASGAGAAASGALTQVDGVWKRTVQVLTTRKAHVDKVCPIAKTSYVYYDDDVYDAVLTEKSTGVTYVTQLLYDTNESAYYVYIRWGEIDYKLDGPHKTIESAKSAFQVTYHDKFGVEWTERETTVSDAWSYEVKTYETFEETEEIEEVVDETEITKEVVREQTVVDKEKEVEVETHTSTTTTSEEVVLEHTTSEVVEVDEAKETLVTKETGVVAKPAVSKGSSWFRRLATGAGVAAVGALTQVDGVWKRTVQVLTTRKAHVDKVCPIAKTSYVYYDDDVYDAVLTEKSTGVTYVTQLLYNTNESAYYVYIRWGEIDYKLDGPHETIESAKSAFQVTYHDKFGVQWTERETAVNDAYSYEVKTYETFEETEEIEEVVDETEITKEVVREQTVVDKEKEVEVETHTSTTTTSEEVVLEHTTSEVVEVDEAKETVVTKETGVVAKPAVSKGSSWFRRIASGAGAAASGALTQVDGVWKRTVQVLTTRKAHVDKVCPIAKTSYVYYDDDVYDAVLTEKSTGVTYVTQLLYDTNESAYYVYVRWGEIDYKLDGPHKTIESAKSAFQVTYHDKFGVEWTERETAVNDTWSYEVKTYESFEETEEIEEVVDETEITKEVVREQTVVDKAKEVEVETHTSTTTTSEEVVLEHTTSEIVEVDEAKETVVTKETGVVAKPAVSKGSSWFRRIASGAGAAASGALTQVDGVWKRTVQVLTTRKAHVDKICPIAKTSYVYYDDDVYDAVLTEKSTGVTYVTQLLYDTTKSAYYVYIRWGEIDYKLDGPHETIESAKSAFQVTYHDKFGVEWTERETTVSDTYSYEVKTYESFEETEEIEEVVDETEITKEVVREQTVVDNKKEVEVETHTSTTTTSEEVVLEHTTSEIVEVDEAKETVVTKETGVVAKPAVSKGSSWFRRIASGAGAAASGALTQVDGVWKRTVQVLTTRKAHVDKVCPIAKTSYVYYDDDVYDAVLTEKSTGVTYVTQLLYDTNESAYYVYIRWGEIDYKLDGPHETIESAKSAFQVTYHDKFGVEWTERETAVNDAYSYEVKTYETFEETEEIEEVVDETEITKEVVREQTVVDKEKEVEVDTHTSTSTTSEIVQVDEAKETLVTKETGVVAKPAVSKGSSWFRRIASGAGAAASGALTQVDGVWKRTVQVLTTRKAHVDKVCPIAKTSYVYYDDDVYDAVLTEKSTGVTYVTQLLYDTNESAYYVYIRWGEIDYKLDGPHETIESAKSAFQVTYHDKFGVQWTERETAVNDAYSYEVKTYETFEETEEIEEVVDETEITKEVVREQTVVDKEKEVEVETHTSTTTTSEEVVLEHTTSEVVEVDEAKETVVTKETGVAKPAVSKGSSWFRRIASGAGAAASGALTQVDGVWKRTVQVLTTRKAHVDKVCPIAKTSYVYYDDDVYDAVLTEKSTGVTYVTQLLYDTNESAYYVYVRWGEIDYKLDGPHKTIESAKSAFQVTYHDKFGVEWTERETAVNDTWSYEVKTYESFEETEEIEEVVDETEITKEVVREQTVIDKEKEVEVETHTSTTTTSEEVVLEHTTSEIVEVDEAKETLVTKETGVVAKPAVSKGSSWFRRLATGAGVAAVGALTQVDGVWKRTVQVLTTRKAHVDKVCPIAKTSYVYYDDDVYDAVLTEKSTGVTYVTQLLYDTNESAYYVYIRWGEIDYKLDGPHKTIESAKSAFQVTYHDKFGVEWTERETTVSDTYSYEVKTYESFEETEEIEEVVDETEISTEVVREQTVIDKEKEVEVETHTSTTTTSEEVVLEHTTSEIVEVDEAKETVVTKETGVVAKPAVSKGSSWFRRIASGAGAAASGALTQVDGVWKRTVQVLTTRKAHVDKVCPIAKTSYVYYDDDVYDAVLTEKSTGVTYVTQLLYDTNESAYYVYVRWGEIDYKLDGPHETIESAKSAFQVTYHDKFGVEWTERETAVNDTWSYEVKTYESFEETEEIEEVVAETEITSEVAREEVTVDKQKDIEVESHTSTTTSAEEVTLEHTSAVVVGETVQEKEDVAVVVEEIKTAVIVEQEVGEVEQVKKTVITKESGVVTKPAVSKGSSWFRRIASGAGAAASGALTQVDGVWKRTVQVLTTRKAHVDKVCPIAKTSYVYYDDDVYDAVLTEKSTGVTYVTQLLYDTTKSAYYVYIRWGEIDYKLDGPHETIESAKSAFQVTYHDKFGVEWTERETAVNDSYSYEVKTYETFEETEEIEEVVDETEITKEVVREQTVVDKEKEVEVETHTSTTTTVEDIVLEHTTSEVVEVDEAKETVVTKETGVVAKPAVSKGSSWFRRLASGAGVAAAGALTQVDGVWKRTVQVLTTRKAHVDKVCPIAKTSYVYYDDDVYDAVLTEKSTGVTYVTQLLYDTNESAYYVYVRWGEIDYKLDGPHKTIESAKSAFQVTYHDKFGVQWTERETAVNDSYSYEVKTYETFEETEEIEEVVDETEITKEVVREQTVVDKEKEVEVETHTSTTTTVEDIVLEHTTKEETVVEGDVKEVVVTKETGVVAKPAVSKGSSWFRRIASGAGAAASGALTQVDGVWKRTVQVLTTRKAHVDKVCPIAKTSYVYYDDDVYDAVLTEKSTGVTYVTQLLYDTNESAYYVYIRWGEIDYKLDGPHKTIEAAKSAFQVTYQDKFGVEWTERETAVNEYWSYEVKTYEAFEETEEIEEVIDEVEVEISTRRAATTVIDQSTVEETSVEISVKDDVVVKEVQKKEVVVDDQVQSKEVVVARTEDDIVKVETTVEHVVDVTSITDEHPVEITVVTKETGVVAKPAVSKGSSWFRRLASGAGVAAAGALTQVDGVWKRTVQVLTTRKAHVDKICPIAKTSYVYYDDDVYDAVLTEKSTGVTYVTQLLYDTNESAYYVYIRWGEIDYKLDGPHKTIESAKSAFQVTYHDKFGVEWTERETAVNDSWSYEVKTYETFEETEEIVEIVDEKDISTTVSHDQKVVLGGDDLSGSTTTTYTTTTTQEGEVLVEHVKHETVVSEGVEIIKEVVTTQETGVVAKPAVSKGSSWFRRLASGAGAAASGALTQVDGVWKRTVQVLTTRKAHVDKICPIAKTSYVYYDDDVYDAVLTEKSTGVTYITQLLYDTNESAYYVYVRWGEIDYKLDGPHKTIESAKSAFQITYHDKFGVQWTERETTVNDSWSYEIKTYETFEETEEIEETVEDYEASQMVARERQVIESDKVVLTEHTVTSSLDDSFVHSSTEQTVTQERSAGAASGSEASTLSQAQFEAIAYAEAEAARRRSGGGISSNADIEKEKSTFFESLPVLGEVGMNVETGAADGVIDYRSGTAQTYQYLPEDLQPRQVQRPRAWVSLHVGGWQNAPHELEGFMRLDDQSGQALMEQARSETEGKAQEAMPIDNLRLPEIVALFAKKLYSHFGEKLPEELSQERLSQL